MTRKRKWVALLICGGAVAQLASCGPILADLLLQQVYVTVLQSILGAALGTNTSTTQ